MHCKKNIYIYILKKEKRFKFAYQQVLQIQDKRAESLLEQWNLS
jgi:hypothetical protein